MKYNLRSTFWLGVLLLCTPLLFTCSNEPQSIFTTTWKLESLETDAYLKFEEHHSIQNEDLKDLKFDVLLKISAIYYSCDTSSMGFRDSMALRILEQNSEQIILTDLREDFKIEIVYLNNSEAAVDFYRKEKLDKNLSGYLIIPDTIYPTYDEKPEIQQLLNWNYYTARAKIAQTQERIDRLKTSSKLSQEANLFLQYLDSLEKTMNSELDSPYSYECIHRDIENYKYHASKFLIGEEPAAPKDNYFSGVQLKEKCRGYYSSITNKELANDLYHFRLVNKDLDELTHIEEPWEIQEFYHVPYHNVILTFRELELLVYQLEKHAKPSVD